MDDKTVLYELDGDRKDVDAGMISEGVSDAAMEKRILWKLDITVLPTLFILFLFSFLDRTSIGNAKLLGLVTDLNLSQDNYNNVLAIYFVFYIASEIPSNLIMKRASPRVWLPLLTVLWGLVTIGQGFVQSYEGLLAARALLGLMEGGLLPGMVTYLSTLYKPSEMGIRLALAYISNPLSGGFGGLLASALYKLGGVGGLAGWRWIFIVEGILTSILGALAYLTLCDSVENAWVLTPEERIYAHQRLKVNKAADVFSTKAFIHGVFGPQTILTGLGFFCILAALYSFGLFAPTIVKALGYTATEAQLYSVPPYFVAAFLTLIVAYISDKYKVRGPSILCTMPLSIIGYAILANSTSNSTRYGALFLCAAGLYTSVPPLLVWISGNLQPYTARAMSSAMNLMMGNCAGFVATFVYPAAQGPNYVVGHTTIMSLLCAGWVFVALDMTYLWYENKQKAAGKRDQFIGSGFDDDPNFKYTL